jgi:hypothetical protein
MMAITSASTFLVTRRGFLGLEQVCVLSVWERLLETLNINHPYLQKGCFNIRNVYGLSIDGTVRGEIAGHAPPCLLLQADAYQSRTTRHNEF